MGLVSFFRRVYSLDTIDTRFTVPSSTPYKAVVESRNDPVAVRERAAKLKHRTQPALWAEPEFLLYYLGVAILVGSVLYLGHDISKRKMDSLSISPFTENWPAY
jgi:protein-cysteine N-palmitoyltransferase HHAT